MRNREIEFVYFDLGNVLLAFDPELACKNLASQFGVTTELARTAVYESGLQDRFEHGEISGEQFACGLRERFGRSAADMPTDGLLDAVSDMFTPIDSMGSVMTAVRGNGYRVGLLSNTCQAHWDWIGRQPSYFVNDFLFDVTVLSFEVGSMKPGSPIYAVAEQRAGVGADRILFLDDKPENVDAATVRGWKAVQCLGGCEAIDALRSLGLLDEPV